MYSAFGLEGIEGIDGIIYDLKQGLEKQNELYEMQ